MQKVELLAVNHPDFNQILSTSVLLYTTLCFNSLLSFAFQNIPLHKVLGESPKL